MYYTILLKIPKTEVESAQPDKTYEELTTPNPLGWKTLKSPKEEANMLIPTTK